MMSDVIPYFQNPREITALRQIGELLGIEPKRA
jgi:hypothetical protein